MFKTRPNTARALLAFPVTILSDKEQIEHINKQLSEINLATVVAGLMKSKLTESQHSDICIKPINLLNKEWGDKNPPRTTPLNKKMKKGRNMKYR